MGPRLISRGDDPSSDARKAVRELQWGRGLLAAEIKNLRGQGLSDNASMGPRLISRGDAASARQAHSYAEASMGPGLISRGDIPVSQ